LLLRRDESLGGPWPDTVTVDWPNRKNVCIFPVLQSTPFGCWTFYTSGATSQSEAPNYFASAERVTCRRGDQTLGFTAQARPQRRPVYGGDHGKTSHRPLLASGFVIMKSRRSAALAAFGRRLRRMVGMVGLIQFRDETSLIGWRLPDNIGRARMEGRRQDAGARRARRHMVIGD
jgi:hypothetical protein